jgi:hypothetical protein
MSKHGSTRQGSGGHERPRRLVFLDIQTATLTALRTALEAAGVEFIEENGGGPGVRLRGWRRRRNLRNCAPGLGQRAYSDRPGPMAEFTEMKMSTSFTHETYWS